MYEYFSESDDDDISLEVSGSDTSFDDFSSSEENDDSTVHTVAIGPDSVGWTKLSNEGMTRPPFPFTGNSDVHFDVDQATGPLQYFEKFFDNDIVQRGPTTGPRAACGPRNNFAQFKSCRS